MSYNTTESLRSFFVCPSSPEEQKQLDIMERKRVSVLPWRGQFSPQLIEYLIEKYAPSNGKLLDPFCGSGTVLYEAANYGLDVTATDINPAAIYLANTARICLFNKKKRKEVLSELNNFTDLLLKEVDIINGCIAVDKIASLLNNSISDSISSTVKQSLVIIACGDARHSTSKKIISANKAIYKLVLSAPMFTGRMEVNIGDARKLLIADKAIDYVITSPPYINVFNYHQNYRPIIEALGYKPLKFARAEVGANRKFRQNRYLTVVQYCMDMALFLTEMSRILKKSGKLTIILGRESNVRGVPYKNGNIIAKIILDNFDGEILEWKERKFLNRYGKEIYEDVITIILGKLRNKDENIIEKGRNIGLENLAGSLEKAPKERIDEIKKAIEAGKTITESPFILE